MDELNSFVEARFHWDLKRFEAGEMGREDDLLTNHEKVLLYKYTDDAYEDLNENLRDETNLFLDFELHLNTVLAKLPSFQGLVYRGAILTTAQIQGYKEAEAQNLPIEELSFTSASKSKGCAMEFAYSKVLFMISSKTAKDIGKFARNPYEEEVLFASKTKFNVLAVTVKNNLTIIQMEEV